MCVHLARPAIQVVQVQGSDHIDLINMTVRWGSFAAIALNPHEYHTGGLNYGNIVNNTVTDTACGTCPFVVIPILSLVCV